MENKQHISDELLAAYLEGNVNDKEMAEVLQAIGKDAELQEALEIALQLEEEEEPMLQMAAEGGRNLCDIQCEAYVLKRYGIDCSVDGLLEVAKKNHWIQRAGTPLNYIGNLLEVKGLKVIRKMRASLNDIVEALGYSCGIIVAVDCDKLYPEKPDEEDATNHAIVVTGMDADAETVRIYDPENIAEIDIHLQLFMLAWKESHYFMVTASD